MADPDDPAAPRPRPRAALAVSPFSAVPPKPAAPLPPRAPGPRSADAPADSGPVARPLLRSGGLATVPIPVAPTTAPTMPLPPRSATGSGAVPVRGASADVLARVPLILDEALPPSRPAPSPLSKTSGPNRRPTPETHEAQTPSPATTTTTRTPTRPAWRLPAINSIMGSLKSSTGAAVVSAVVVAGLLLLPTGSTYRPGEARALSEQFQQHTLAQTATKDVEGAVIAIARTVSDDDDSHKVLVLRDPVPELFTLPDHTLVVTTGLLARLETDAQLAGLIAHVRGHEELGHLERIDALEGPGVPDALKKAATATHTASEERRADDVAFELLERGGWQPHALARAEALLLADAVGWSQHHVREVPRVEGASGQERPAWYAEFVLPLVRLAPATTTPTTMTPTPTTPTTPTPPTTPTTPTTTPTTPTTTPTTTATTTTTPTTTPTTAPTAAAR